MSIQCISLSIPALIDIPPTSPFPKVNIYQSELSSPNLAFQTIPHLDGLSLDLPNQCDNCQEVFETEEQVANHDDGFEDCRICFKTKYKYYLHEPIQLISKDVGSTNQNSPNLQPTEYVLGFIGIGR